MHSIQLPYKKSRLRRSIGTNFCDYNSDFYKKLSLETVMTALYHEIRGFLVIIQSKGILIGDRRTIIFVINPTFFKMARLRYFSCTHV